MDSPVPPDQDCRYGKSCHGILGACPFKHPPCSSANVRVRDKRDSNNILYRKNGFRNGNSVSDNSAEIYDSVWDQETREQFANYLQSVVRRCPREGNLRDFLRDYQNNRTGNQEAEDRAVARGEMPQISASNPLFSEPNNFPENINIIQDSKFSQFLIRGKPRTFSR